MSTCIGLVHATLAAVQPMIVAFRRHAPEVTLLHFLDEGLLPMVEREGLTSRARVEVIRLAQRAAASGANGVLLTCSAYSPVVPEIQEQLSIPVESVDEAMLRRALELGRTVGVVATVDVAGPTTAALLRAYAAEAGLAIDLHVRVVPEAFVALKQDDPARHDELVREQIAAMAPTCDVVVLAQISMARAIAEGPPCSIPVLTSPELSIRSILRRVLDSTV